MKAILQFSIIILLFTFSKTNAQETDSLGTKPLMKSRNQIYIAEIETSLGTQKGILYKADSSEIVLLDSLYQQVHIYLYNMRALKIYRLNAALYGAKVGFLIPSIPFTAIGILIYTLSGSVSFPLGSAFLIAGLGGGIIYGILLAVINPLIPHTSIRNIEDFQEKYYRKLRYIKLKTQEVLIKKHPKKVRLV
jgi:hypothetical protein